MIQETCHEGRLLQGRPVPPTFWAAALVLLGFVGVELIARQLGAAAEETKKPAEEHYFDFRGHPIPAELTAFGFGDEDDRFLRVEPEGLRVTLPRTWIHPWGGVGFQTAFGIGGDFEVTAALEILHADSPPSGYGVGARLRVKKANPSPEGATFCRSVRARGKQILLWDRSVGQPGEKPRTTEGSVPCAETVGRLRLKRTGTTLHYLWAAGTRGDVFQEIHQCEFGAEDIQNVQLGVITGLKPCDVDVRLIDLRIRSVVGVDGGRPNEPPAPEQLSSGQSSQQSRPKKWLIALALCVVIFLSFAALGWWLRVRRSRHAAKERDSAGVADQQEAAPSAAPALSFACSSCGKHLKVRAEMAGKKIKCPQCGKTAVVPAADTYRA
ncbi:MAG TPA: DUF1583 domain-containing protein [Gemmataceae bacterium]|nr:DUF1583 domain-containing protein [Gemmataceae bacterium]